VDYGHTVNSHETGLTQEKQALSGSVGPMTAKLTQAVAAALEQEAAAPLSQGLYLVATPIGNLADITLRALSVLSRADCIYCEDTRHTQKLLNRYDIAARLSAYHDHNAARERPKILQRLRQGGSAALVSDAGTPLISDPGYKLVSEAAAEELPVISIPGPSAVLAGLAASGLPTDSYFFAGFLPPKQVAAKKRLQDLATVPATIILFETAARLDTTLNALGELFAGRQLVIARELTKRFEELLRVTLPANDLPGRDWKGEFVLLLSPPVDEAATEETIIEALNAAMRHASLRDAVDDVKRTLRAPRKQVYDLALRLQKNGSLNDDV